MKPKHRRLLFVLGCLAVMSLGAAIILSSLRDTMIFFYTPTQLAEKKSAADFNPNQALRIGGLVKNGSIHNVDGGGIRFTITDLSAEVNTTYKGLVPSLFRDGQGVVAQGTLQADGSMIAETILAKHDENYMPREVMDALKKSGRWNETSGYKNGGAK
jgi:cytochrome c-type biogenesis protein CcmE